jgi:hypothetical protein
MRDQNAAIEALYRGRSLRGEPLQVTPDTSKFFEFGEQLEVDMPVPLDASSFSARRWNIPVEYQSIDIEAWLREKATTPEERERVEIELNEYRARNLLPVLQALLYIVDIMKQNNVVWGVGRGSSVASFCLYLLGVHRINSLEHQLSIKEFFK